jgi:hypothetical protein
MSWTWPGSRLAAAGLLVANLVPLVGVAAFGWKLHSVLVVYWVESGVVGIESIAKVLRAEGNDDPSKLPSIEFNDKNVSSFVGKSKRAIATFFVFHYGMFWAVHGLFVFLLPPLYYHGGFADFSTVALAGLALAAYHGISYQRNYVAGGEFECTGPVTQMVEPYKRVFVLHMTIVLGAFGVAMLGAPAGALIVMVLVKTGLDLFGHWREHDRARRRTPTPAAKRIGPEFRRS